MVERLFLAEPLGCLRFVIVVFPDHNHLLFSMNEKTYVFKKFTNVFDGMFAVLSNLNLPNDNKRVLNH